jgi:PAS domain S-box-containing protein
MVVAGLDVNGVRHQHSPLEAQVQATLNIVPAYVWYALPSGALTFVNERTADYLGLPKDHSLRSGTDTGVDWDSHIPLLHADDREETRRVWSDCLRTGCAGEVSLRLRNAEGGYRWFLSRAEPVRAANGTLLYWIGVNLDIEERKQAWCIRKIGNSSSNRFKRCWRPIRHSTSRSESCGLTDRFEASVTWAFSRLRKGLFGDSWAREWMSLSKSN